MKAFYSVMFCMLLLACGEKKEGDKTIYLPASNGNLNTISVVADNVVWEGEVGESIRNIFAAPLNGLPTEEPMFNMRQIPTQVFDGFAARSRIVLKIEKGAEATVKVVNNAFAKPQTVVVVGGKTDVEIIAGLKENRDKIVDAFNKEEVKEKLRRINLSLLADEDVEKALGITIDIPSVYRISKADKDFFWIRKNLKNNKTIELMLYEVPLETISKSDSTIMDIVKMRNEITKTKIPGEDGIYMAVEDSYAPSMFKTIIYNKPAFVKANQVESEADSTV